MGKESMSVEKYIKDKNYKLTGDQEAILLSAIKNQDYHFKHLDKVAKPNSCAGQNMIMGLGIQKIYKNEEVYMDSGKFIVDEIVRGDFDGIIEEIINIIKFVLNQESPIPKKGQIEAAETNVEELIENINLKAYSFVSDIKNEVGRNNSWVPIKDFRDALKKMQIDIFVLQYAPVENEEESV